MSLGKVRQAQIISTYGPGSLIPVGEESFMVAGTDFWFGMGEPNPEEILLMFEVVAPQHICAICRCGWIMSDMWRKTRSIEVYFNMRFRTCI